MDSCDCNSIEEYGKLVEGQKKELQDWIKGRFIRHSRVNRKASASSYGFKHIFSNDRHGFYITNGCFKGAMLEAGHHPVDEREINWHFNVKFFPLK